MRKFKFTHNSLFKNTPMDSGDPEFKDEDKFEVQAGKEFYVEGEVEEEGSHFKVPVTLYVYKGHIEELKNEEEGSKGTPGSNGYVSFSHPNNREGNIKRIIESGKHFGLTKPQISYCLATTEHETGDTFLAVEEAFWLSDNWRRANLRYYPYHGRGFVQLTWETNYQKYQDLTGLPLVSKPELVLGDPDLSTYILIHGSKNGTFTGRKLSDYINSRKKDYYNARRIINGTDKASHIANLAVKWENRL